MPGDTHAIHRMKEMWCYMEYVFDDCKKEIKAIKKSQKAVGLYAKKANHKFSSETEYIKELDKLVN